MKRFIAILLCVLTVMSFAGCTMGNNAALQAQREKENAEKNADTSKKEYEATFDGLVSNLMDKGLIKGKGGELDASIIGAKNGKRYSTDDKNFVEIYEIDTKATPDEAQKMHDVVVSGGVYDVYGISKLKGAVSKSGNFVILYPASSKYDYSKIIEELKNF